MLIFFLLKIKSKKVSIYSIYYNDFSAVILEEKLTFRHKRWLNDCESRSYAKKS
jgi:hypothetical protein